MIAWSSVNDAAKRGRFSMKYILVKTAFLFAMFFVLYQNLSHVYATEQTGKVRFDPVEAVLEISVMTILTIIVLVTEPKKN